MVAMPACLGRVRRLNLRSASTFALLRLKKVAQNQQCCSVLPQAIIARDQYSAKDWVRPGLVLHNEGLRPKHPVVVVPGE